METDRVIDLSPGAYFGAYRVVRSLGSGGMGDVVLVDAPVPGGRQYAVKILNPRLAGDDGESLARFVREAEFSLKSRHPNLVEVYEVGRDPETGLCYIVMEHLTGGSLRALLEANLRGLSVAGSMAIAADICRALAFAGERGIVHRDVKPENVLFAADGRAKLADFGISRFAGGCEVQSGDKNLIGTPAYMAPEQMLDPSAVDGRADLYGLGVMLHEMLTGSRPNAGEPAMRTLAAALGGRVYPDIRRLRPEIPAPVAALVDLLLRPSPSERPASARHALELCLEPSRIDCRRLAPMPGRSRPWYCDRRVLAAAGALFAAAAALAAVLVVKGGE